eukprot:GHVL01023082.1.p1 GENE.GHVL01023082.1~~GHVL01023082.1.p1  ORF type:complete len:150 (-),score=15.49 GHVL01023082.1:45-494(-)
MDRHTAASAFMAAVDKNQARKPLDSDQLKTYFSSFPQQRKFDTLAAYRKAFQDHLFSNIDCTLTLFDAKFCNFMADKLNCLRPEQEDSWHHNRATDFHSDDLLRATNSDVLKMVAYNQIAATTAEFKSAAALKESQKNAKAIQTAADKK